MYVNYHKTIHQFINSFFYTIHTCSGILKLVLLLGKKLPTFADNDKKVGR